MSAEPGVVKIRIMQKTTVKSSADAEMPDTSMPAVVIRREKVERRRFRIVFDLILSTLSDHYLPSCVLRSRRAIRPSKQGQGSGRER